MLPARIEAQFAEVIGEFGDKPAQVGKLLRTKSDDLALRRSRAGLLNRRVDRGADVHNVVRRQWKTRDGDMGKWVATLDAARTLGAKIVCTGHGPRSVGTVLDDQQAFFIALAEQVGALMANRPPEEAKAQIESIRATLKGNAQIARFVAERGAGWDSFPSQVEKVYEELTGKNFVALMNERQLARHAHARSLGLASG